MYKVYTDKEKEQLLIKHDQLIKHLANKYTDKDWGFEDTYQELCMMFIKMLDKHDPEKGKITTLFYRYVSSWFSGALMQQKYAKKRVPYKNIDFIDALSSSISSNTSSIDRNDFFSFMGTDENSPDKIEYQERVVSFIISEAKKLPRPGIILGVLFHNKTMKDFEEVYGLSHQAIRHHFNNNLKKLKKALDIYLDNNSL